MDNRREIRRVARKYRRAERQIKLKTQLWRALPLALPVLFAVVIGLLYLYMQPQKRYTLPADALGVYVLDIGQGDAVLIRCQGHAALLDAGETDCGTDIAQKLRALGIQRLDYVINSHPHADHIGGMQAVLRLIPADLLILPEIPDPLIPTAFSYQSALEAAAEHGIPVQTAVCHQTLTLGDAKLELLCTDNGAYSDLNNCSLGCLLTYGSHSFLFAGDLEKEGEQAFLDAGLIPAVDILKVSHHGSNTSSTEAFLAAAHPAFAAISVGAANDYGHPAAACLQRLREAGTEVFRTDLDGTILFVTDGSTMQIQPGFRFD